MTSTRILLVLLLAGAIPAQAAPRWLTAVPRSVGRTYGNMFTFKHPVLALEQWASVGAVAFDERTTTDLFHRCPTCVESGLIYHNGRYNGGIAILGTIAAGTFYSTLEQYGDELIRDDPNKFWRNANNFQVATPLAIHIQAGVHNMGVATFRPIEWYRPQPSK